MSDVEIVQTSSLSVMMKAEIDQQIATAHAFPRSIAKFQAEARSMALLDSDTAASCFYVLPRGNGIEGPSARLAEIVGSAWGNLRYGARVVEVGDKFITAEGVCHDLQRNVAASVSVRRRITSKDGKRYNDDMIMVTCNAACSIALRNAIFKVVPFAYVKPIYEECRKVAAGEGVPLADNRKKWLDYWNKQGVKTERVLWALGKPSVADIDQGDIAKMIGFTTAIKDGDAALETIFPLIDPNTPEEAPPMSKAARAAQNGQTAQKVPVETPETALESSGDAGTPQDTPQSESGPSYGEKLGIILAEQGYDKAIALKKLADVAGVKYQILRDAIDNKKPLDEAACAALVKAGVSLKGL